MNSKSTLVLMEQLVMILVFALAAALCLKAFVWADRASRDNELRTQAVFLAQNAAETVKACRGDFDTAAGLLDGQFLGDTLQIRYDQTGLPVTEDAPYAFLLQVTKTPHLSPAADLDAAEVCVSAGGDPLITLQILWRAS